MTIILSITSVKPVVVMVQQQLLFKIKPKVKVMIKQKSCSIFL